MKSKFLDKFRADWSEFKKNSAEPTEADARTNEQLARLDHLNAKVDYFATSIEREDSPDQQELFARIEPLRDHYRQLKAQLKASRSGSEEFPEKQRAEFDRGVENYRAEVEEFQSLFFQSGPDARAVPNRESLIETFPPRG